MTDRQIDREEGEREGRRGRKRRERKGKTKESSIRPFITEMRPWAMGGQRGLFASGMFKDCGRGHPGD